MASQDPDVQNPNRKRRLETAGECPICISPFIGEVYQCVEGHVICERCLGALLLGGPRCPTCRIPLNPLIRNRALEDIAVLDPSEELEIFEIRKEARARELDNARIDLGCAKAELADVQKKMADKRKELEQVQRKLANAKKEVRSGGSDPEKVRADIARVTTLVEAIKKVETHNLSPYGARMVGEWKDRTLEEALGAKK
jgi:hypothetical protein